MDRRRCQEAALRFARAWIPTLPVAGKVPLTKRGVHDATTQESRIGFWFRNFSDPRLGVAVATGHPLRSGGYLLVLDVDTKDGTDGEYTLAELEGKHEEPIPPTWTVRTPSGGLHYWLRTPKPLGCKVGFRHGLDTRGVGGYVVTAPSPGYTVESRSPIADAPNWLLYVLDPPERTAPAVTLLPNSAKPSEIGPRYVEVAIERECQDVASAPEGCRNDTLNRAAFALARFVADGQADARGVIRALTIAATFCGLGEREITKTIDSAFRARKAAA